MCIRDRPYTGVNEARVDDMEINPADAVDPTVAIPANTGITMKSTSKANDAKSGRMIISSDICFHAHKTWLDHAPKGSFCRTDGT